MAEVSGRKEFAHRTFSHLCTASLLAHKPFYTSSPTPHFSSPEAKAVYANRFTPQRLVHQKQKPFTPKAFTPENFCTTNLLHQKPFTLAAFYTLDQNFFTPNGLYTPEAEAFYTTSPTMKNAGRLTSIARLECKTS